MNQGKDFLVKAPAVAATPSVVMSCGECGSTALVTNESAVSDDESNVWTLDDVHGNIFCHGCEREVRQVIKSAVFDNWPDAKRFARNETSPYGHAWITCVDHVAPFTVSVCDDVDFAPETYGAEFKNGEEQ